MYSKHFLVSLVIPYHVLKYIPISVIRFMSNYFYVFFLVSNLLFCIKMNFFIVHLKKTDLSHNFFFDDLIFLSFYIHIFK